MYIYKDKILKNKNGEYFTEEYLKNNHIDVDGYSSVDIRELPQGAEITCNYSQLFRPNDNMIYSCDILELVDYDCDCVNGGEYDCDSDEYCEIYQTYLIDNSLSGFLCRHTDEIIYEIPKFGLNVLGVTHYGTSWDYVPATFRV